MSNQFLFYLCIYVNIFVISVLSEIFELPGATVPVKGKLVGSINITDEYVITFDYIMNSLYTPCCSVFANVFLIGNEPDIGGVDRYPGIFVNNGETKLGGGFTDVGNHNIDTSRPNNTDISVGVVYNLRYEISQSWFIVYLNGTLVLKSPKNYHITNVVKDIWMGIGHVVDIGVPDVILYDFKIETFDYNEIAGDILTPCGISSNNLVSWYISDDFVETVPEEYVTLRWLDRSGKGNHILTSHIDGNIMTDNVFEYIKGGINESIVIPYELKSSGYTLFHLSRYETTNNINRIFTSDCQTINWLSGFHYSGNGVAFHEEWITNNTFNINNTEWILSTDQFNLYRGNKQDFTNNNTQIIPFNVTVTINKCVSGNTPEKSDWGLYEIMIFDTELTELEYTCIENYIYNKYSCNGDNILGTRSCSPTVSPTLSTFNPTIIPSVTPTSAPTNFPSITPSIYPSLTPTIFPTLSPTLLSNEPTIFPTSNPTKLPTTIPTTSPIPPTNVSSSNNTPNQIVFTTSNILITCIAIFVIGIIIIAIIYCKLQKQRDSINFSTSNIKSQSELTVKNNNNNIVKRNELNTDIKSMYDQKPYSTTEGMESETFHHSTNNKIESNLDFENEYAL